MTRKEFIELMLMSIDTKMGVINGLPSSRQTQSTLNQRVILEAEAEMFNRELALIRIDKRRAEYMKERGLVEVPPHKNHCPYQFTGDDAVPHCRKDNWPMYGKPCNRTVCRTKKGLASDPLEYLIDTKDSVGFLPECYFQVGLDSGHVVICSYPQSPHYNGPCSKRCVCMGGFHG